MLYIKNLLTFITLHPTLAYAAVFLVALSESLALVGLIVPGTMIMFGVGAIVATGSLDLRPVLLLAAAGAVAGDGISFWLGRHYHEELRRIWPFTRYPGMLKRGEAFFHRHGGKSILFGRFVGPVRPVIPVVAGMLGMGPLSFSVVNVFSALGWALVYTLPGVFFGTSLAVAGAVSSRLAVLLAIVLAVIWGFVWLSRKLATLVGLLWPLWLAALKDWVAADKSRPALMLPVKRFLSPILMHRQGEEVFLGFLVLLFFLAGWGFLGVLQDVLTRDPLVAADQAVYHFFQSLRTPWADHILTAITELGDSIVNICLCLAVLLVLLGNRRYRTAGYWLMTTLGGFLGVELLKLLVHLPRPTAIYQGVSTYGFPSAHTTMSAVIYGFLAIIIARNLSGRLQWGFFITVFVISFFVALSRLYLGAHWLSDVLGGFLIGTGWTALLGIAYIKGQPESIPRRLLGLVVLLVLVVVGGWHVHQRHEKDLALYTPRNNIQSMPLITWLGEGWRQLPGWRIDLEGDKEQPLTIQLAGTLDQIANYLLTVGWQRPPMSDMKKILGMLSPDTKLEDLPVLPRLHNGRGGSLLLVRQVDGQRWVLRIWPTDMTIMKDDTPLFVGAIEVQKRRHTAGLLTLAEDTGKYEAALAALQKDLLGRFAEKLVSRSYNDLQVNHEDQPGDKTGSVLLVWDKRLMVGEL